jgi:hypothetical protein
VATTAVAVAIVSKSRRDRRVAAHSVHINDLH